jgi:hypothetical protein
MSDAAVRANVVKLPIQGHPIQTDLTQRLSVGMKGPRT